MLIKLYTNNRDIILIENVTDVCIKEGLKEYRPWQPSANPAADPYEDVFFDTYGMSVAAPSPTDCLVVREITYSKDGCKRLYLMKRAYVCNDDGKTLHVVEAGYDTVPV